MVRVVTVDVRNKFVYRDDENSALKGICIDLWRRIAKDLNLTYVVEEVDSWSAMMNKFKEGEADVIMQRINDGDMLADNITE